MIFSRTVLKLRETRNTMFSYTGWTTKHCVLWPPSAAAAAAAVTTTTTTTTTITTTFTTSITTSEFIWPWYFQQCRRCVRVETRRSVVQWLVHQRLDQPARRHWILRLHSADRTSPPNNTASVSNTTTFCYSRIVIYPSSATQSSPLHQIISCTAL